MLIPGKIIAYLALAQNFIINFSNFNFLNHPALLLYLLVTHILLNCRLNNAASGQIICVYKPVFDSK
jgi:hypothetical protein